jgi:hypothetical protein
MYIFDFGKWVDARINEGFRSLEQPHDLQNLDRVKKHMCTRIPILDEHAITIDKNSVSPIEKKPIVEINSEMKVKSFISRFINS